jgi:hypothetical protein
LEVPNKPHQKVVAVSRFWDFNLDYYYATFQVCFPCATVAPRTPKSVVHVIKHDTRVGKVKIQGKKGKRKEGKKGEFST